MNILLSPSESNRQLLNGIIWTYHLPAVAQVLRYDIKEDLRIKTHKSICGWVISIRLVELKFESSARDFRLPGNDYIHSSTSSPESPYKIVNLKHVINPMKKYTISKYFDASSTKAPVTGAYDWSCGISRIWSIFVEISHAVNPDLVN